MHSYDKDEMTDHVREFAYISSVGETAYGERANVTIHVGCGSEGAYLSFFYQKTTIEMMYRIDASPPVKVTNFFDFDDWHSSTVHGQEGRELIEKLLHGSVLRVRRMGGPSALSETDHTFNVGENTLLVRKILQKCS